MEVLFQYRATHTTKDDLVFWREKYGDRLGLPLIMSWNSPLRLSVAHRQPDFGMLSGWPVVQPFEVQQRISNDAANNMLIESRSINMARQDLGEEQCADMDLILRSVNVLKHCYDSQQSPPTGRSIPDIMITENIDAVDSFEGEGFNDDVENEPDQTTLSPPLGAPTCVITVTEAANPEVDSSRPPAKYVRDILSNMSEAVFKETVIEQRFREDTQLFVLLGRAHDYVDQGKSDEAHDEISEISHFSSSASPAQSPTHTNDSE